MAIVNVGWPNQLQLDAFFQTPNSDQIAFLFLWLKNKFLTFRMNGDFNVERKQRRF